MALPHATRVQLANEGIDSVADLADFDKDTLSQVAINLKKPGDRIPNPDPNADPGSTIPRPPYTFGAKSQKRLLAACDLVRFYASIGRDLTAGNMRWDPIIRNFEQQWKALKDRKEDDEPEVPKITKNLSVIKWTEAFDDFLHRKIGVRTIPLAYVTRETVEVPAACPERAQNAPHTQTFGSVEADLVARASHDHPLFRDDNAAVYYDLETATRATSYAASIKPYQRAKDGRGAWFSIKGQYAGQDKWLAEIKRQDDLLHNRKWKGQSNFSLAKFIAQHRNAFVSMQQCAQHVQFQLPNEFTRVGYLLDAIECSDAGLQAGIALVRADDGPDGKMNDFEAAASFLLPYDPVAKKRAAQGSKRDYGEIADVNAEEQVQVSTADGTNKKKPAIGKTGVEFRFYKKSEYSKLTDEQKLELRNHRLQREEKTKTKEESSKTKEKKVRWGSEPRQAKKWVAAAVEQHLAKAKDEAEEAKDIDDEFRRYIASVMSDSKPSGKTKPSEKQSPPITLQGIIRKAKN